MGLDSVALNAGGRGGRGGGREGGQKGRWGGREGGGRGVEGREVMRGGSDFLALLGGFSARLF
jgi:hypothetical protein